MAAQRLDDPNHALGILPAIALKLCSHFEAFIVGHVTEMNAQKFLTRLPAFAEKGGLHWELKFRASVSLRFGAINRISRRQRP